MTRSLELELMDSPEVNGAVLERFHRDLETVHKLLGTFRTIERFIRRDNKPIRRVLDVGCGSGALLRYLKHRMGVEVIGVDLKPGASNGIPLIVGDAVRDPLPEADVAVSSLVAHHLTPEQIVQMIHNVGLSCRRFVIHDLVRDWMPLVLFSVFIGPVIGGEARLDGRQSIRRAYTAKELSALVREALSSARGAFSIDVSPIKSRQIIDVRFE